MSSNTKATIITIGDELLIGQIIDTNSAWIAQQLNLIGIDVIRRVAIADSAAAIKESLDEELQHADLILMTGGLGPTADDITKPTLCQYFGGKIITNVAVLQHVKDIFLKRNRPLLERNLKQAEVPDNCTVIHNPMGTAPGMLFEKEGKIIVSMPGVPYEMKSIMTSSLLPMFAEKYKRSNAIVHRTVLTFGEGESFLAERIKDIEEGLPPHIALAYLPSPYTVKLRLTAHGTEEESLIKETEYYRDAIAQRVQDHLVGFEDQPYEVLAGTLLKAKGLTIGLAESCTAGYIAHRLTQQDGSSEYFRGGVVCYATDIKTSILGIELKLIQEHGVVSAAVAEAMALGAINSLGGDIGLGITGIFSNSAYEDPSPMGTVYIALAHKNGKQITKHYHMRYDRHQNKETATQIALFLIFNFVRNLEL